MEREDLIRRVPLFVNRVAVLATMHRKEEAIAPILEPLGLKVIVPPNFDTDRFGTFSRDVKRFGTQLEAAKAKAERALQITGETIAIASEGSFVPHPAFPSIPCNRELVLLLDKEQDLEIIGEAISMETNYRQQKIHTVQEAIEFAEAIGFPAHGLIAFINSPGDTQIIKGINTQDELLNAVALGLQSAKELIIETDMRALYNPTRMKNIAKATHDLIRKIQQVCPNCDCPGFAEAERRKGLPCMLCHFPTELTLTTIYQCKKCGSRQEKLFPDGQEKADPGQCAFCNP
ncbi:MAG: hypothetical protein HC769_02330 [Cyanobacteria bacterium CRU_2_1]|nr:hypothetical protein [Cyanobacteria bacterium RU_5_0]NJR57789.1 hypothetical protein [Cyanobacteria bacterium CRU_2_1]